MKKILFYLIFSVIAQAANYNCTSTGTGDFNAAGTWSSCNSTYPNNSTDTFTFSVGSTHVVTLPSGAEATVGQSLAANTAQGTVANTGKLVLAADLTGTDPTILTMKGDLAGTTVGATCTLDGATNCNYVEMNPGTVLLIDSDGSGTAYAVGQTANGSSRWFKADCSDSTVMPLYSAGTTYSIGQRVAYNNVNYISIANSNTGNTPSLFDSAYWKKGNCAILSIGATNAVFGFRGFGFGGGNFYGRHVVIRNLGTSSVGSFNVNTNGTNNPAGGWNVTDSTLDGCGEVIVAYDSSTSSNVILRRNIFQNGTNSSGRAFSGDTAGAANSTGTREFSENVVIGQVFAASGTSCRDCIIEGNYVQHNIGSGMNWSYNSNSRPATRVKGNLLLKNPATQSGLNVQTAETSYNYVVNGPATINQNSINPAAANLVGLSTTVEYNVAALLNGDTAGDSFVINQSTNGATATIRRNSTELNRDNTSVGNLITDLGTSSPGGTDNHIAKNNFYMGTTWSLYNVETSYHWAGSITLQNNTMMRWNSTGSVAKLVDTNSCTTNPNDMCSSGQCNYNLGIDLSYTPPGGCTNAHNFYVLDLSAGTGWGANDTSVSSVAEAMFADLTRTFATAATDFFGEVATAGAWSNASVSYAVGDIVSDSQSIWQGKTVLYRALAAHTSADTSRPGNGATWQTACGGGPCWEYATAYFVRHRIARGVRITDASIGADNDFIPQAMAKWNLHGKISQRRDLQCIGDDGESPWPIPYCERGRTVAAAIMGF